MQVVQGGEACGPGGDGDVVPGEQLAGVLDGGAEGGGVDAEQVGQDVQRQAEAARARVAVSWVVRVSLGGLPRGGGGGRGQVEMVLAGGGGGEFQPGDEAAEVAGGHPGQRGVGQAAAAWSRHRPPVLARRGRAGLGAAGLMV